MFSRTTHIISFFFVLLILAASPPLPLEAQRIVPDDEWCRQESRTDDQARYCEVREYTLDARSLVKVNSAPNGSIRVEGRDRNEITLRARISAWSRTGEPELLVRGIEVRTGETITARGPSPEQREGWSVSFRLIVPRGSSLDLQSVNGSVHIAGVTGDMDFKTTNGSVTLADLGGKVRGRTTNGAVNVELSGNRWEGEGLDVQTTNGSVTLAIPEDYRATLETGTVHGGFETDFPITVQGRLRTNRITTDLNGGGPTIRAATTNGPVRIRKR
jgi:hypothetical protein